MNDYLNFN